MTRTEARDLAGKVAVVTGATSGIGHAAALGFARAGARVAAAARGAAGGERLQAEMAQAGHECVFVAADVTLPADAARIFERARSTFGRVDILVNAVGGSLAASVVETSPADWERVLATNLTSTFLVCREAWPVLTVGGGGVIVNIAGTFGLVPVQRRAAYAAAKAGVVMLTRQMALDGAPLHIRVNCVCPGFVDTPATASMSPEARRRAMARIPLARAATADEVTDAVLYLASQKAAYVTGAVLVVDGGQSSGFYSVSSST